MLVWAIWTELWVACGLHEIQHAERRTYNFTCLYRVTQKKRELLKTPTKIEEIQEKKVLTEIEPLKLAF